MHGRSRHTDNARESRRAELAGLTQRDDPTLHPRRGLMRTRPRTTRPVLETSLALVLITRPPLMRGLTGDVHRLGRRRDRPTILDPLTKPKATLRGEWSVTVHRALLGAVCCRRTAPHSPRGHFTQRMSTTSQGTTPRAPGGRATRAGARPHAGRGGAAGRRSRSRAARRRRGPRP